MDSKEEVLLIVKPNKSFQTLPPRALATAKRAGRSRKIAGTIMDK